MLDILNQTFNSVLNHLSLFLPLPHLDAFHVTPSDILRTYSRRVVPQYHVDSEGGRVGSVLSADEYDTLMRHGKERYGICAHEKQLHAVRRADTPKLTLHTPTVNNKAISLHAPFVFTFCMFAFIYYLRGSEEMQPHCEFTSICPSAFRTVTSSPVVPCSYCRWPSLPVTRRWSYRSKHHSCSSLG